MAVPLLALIPALAPVLGKILDFIPNGDERAKAEADLQRAVLDSIAKEAADNREINRTEATHQSLFVAGWRPAIGWGCGLCIMYGYILQPLLSSFVAVNYPESMALIPVFPMEHVWELLFGLLGIGGLRTFEKCKGKA